MKKITFFLLFFLSFGSLFAQNKVAEDNLFEQGESLFYKRLHTGDPNAYKEADSIFTILKTNNNFESVQQEIATELYLLRIHQNETEKENLHRVSKLIDKYNDQHVDAPQLYDMLLYYQQLFRYRTGKTDAEDKILALINQQLEKKEPNYEIVSTAYDNLGRAAYAEHNFEKAAEYGEQSIKFYEKAGFKSMYVAAIQFTGGAYHWMDKVELSLQYMEKAYRLLKTFEKPNALRLSQLAFNIAIINAGQLGNDQKSIKFYKESIHYQIEAKGETDFLVMLYSLLADSYFDLKDIEQAEYYAEKGYVLANDVLKIESVYYRSLPSMTYAKIYAAKGDFGSARKMIDKVVEESVTFFGENDKFTVQTFIDKANVEREAKNYKEAETYLLRAIKASENVDRVYTTLSSYQQLSNLYLEIGDYSKAVATGKIGKMLNDEALEGDYEAQVEDNLFLVEGYLGLKKLDSAKTYMKAAQKILNNGKGDTGIILKLRALSLENKLLLEKYKTEKSIGDLNQAYANVKVLINKIIEGKSSFKYINSKLYYSENIVSSISTAMETCHLEYALMQDPKVLSTIFKLMELNKSSILLDGINDLSLKTEFGVPESLIEAEAKQKSKLMKLNKDLYLLNMTDDSVKNKDNLLDKRLAINYSLDSIQAILKSEYPKYYEALEFHKTKDLAYYQKNSLEEHQALVEYYIDDTIIYRITLTKNNMAYNRIEVEKDWEKKVTELHKNLTERKETASLSLQLGKLLLPKFPSSVTDIIFVLDKSLNQIPFEVLPYHDKYLINTYNISYAGSFQLYEKQKEIRREQKFNWIGFAPKYIKAFLFNNKEEVQSINEIVQGDAVVGERATKQRLIELSEKASVLHLAAHTELDKLNPMLNKILFTENGNSNALTASEIYGLPLKADLAVLSACNTGTGIYRGDGVMSMSRAFTYAGTSSTVMSLWKVPDQQTSEIMVLFYKFLKKGQTKSEALRNAKLNYLEQAKYQEFVHPFYWAGFVLSGDNSPIHFSEPFWKSPIFIIALLIVLVALLVIVYFRKRKNNSTSL